MKLPRADHRKVIAAAKRLAIRNATAETFWDGQPCEASLCQVVIAQTFIGNPLHGLAGTVRNAVMVVSGQETFYLDNPNGAAWLMLTEGRGDTKLAHRILPVREVLENAETIELKHGRSQPEVADQ
jgi:hypothetical protein